MQESEAEKEIAFFKQKNYDVVHSERGGLITLHNPGQLLCYPIVDLHSLKMGPFVWIEFNLKWIQESLKAFQVPSKIQTDAVGVFTDKGKIASLGFRIKNGISTHGLAINVKNDLTDFASFNPCGLCQAGTDKVENYQPGVSLKSVQQVMSDLLIN